MDRAQLNRAVWLELSKRYEGGDISRDDAVRAMREDACCEITQCTRPDGMHATDYADLSDDETRLLLRYVRFGELPDKRYPIVEFATSNQVKRLRWLAIECAITLFTWQGVQIRLDGRVLTAPEAQAKARSDWRHRNLRGSMYSVLHTHWVHPLLHRYLKEGGLRYDKREPRNPEYFHWEDLKHTEADYLIKRFTAMYNSNLTRGAVPIKAGDYNTN